MNINPTIFKAYDIRGLYPGEINEDVARQIGRGFVAYLKPATIAVSRDMRVSSPSITAAVTNVVSEWFELATELATELAIDPPWPGCRDGLAPAPTADSAGTPVGDWPSRSA